MKKAEPEEESTSGPLITPELLEEFKELYRDEVGVEFSDEDTLERALNFLKLFEAIYRPIPADPDAPVPPQTHPEFSDDHPGPTSDGGRQLKLF